jgi:hypothetical protein
VDDVCSECGARIEGGRDACRRVFDRYSALASTDIAYGRSHWLLVDTYAMQHLDPFCISAKSFAAHIMGLCWAVEHGGGPAGYAAIPRWLNGTVPLEKPPAPLTRGATTLIDVANGSDRVQHASLVQAWARHVWSAYNPHHELARRWLSLALAHHPRRR